MAHNREALQTLSRTSAKRREPPDNVSAANAGNADSMEVRMEVRFSRKPRRKGASEGGCASSRRSLVPTGMPALHRGATGCDTCINGQEHQAPMGGAAEHAMVKNHQLVVARRGATAELAASEDGGMGRLCFKGVAQRRPQGVRCRQVIQNKTAEGGDTPTIKRIPLSGRATWDADRAGHPPTSRALASEAMSLRTSGLSSPHLRMGWLRPSATQHGRPRPSAASGRAKATTTKAEASCQLMRARPPERPAEST